MRHLQANRAGTTVECFNWFQPLGDCIDTNMSRSKDEPRWKGHNVHHNREVKNNTPQLKNICQKHRPNDLDEPEDKYDLALEVRNKNKQKLAMAKSNSTVQQWDRQNADMFGFIFTYTTVG